MHSNYRIEYTFLFYLPLGVASPAGDGFFTAEQTRDAERKAELLKVLEAEKARAPPSFAELLRLENCEARMTSLVEITKPCLLYTSPSPRDATLSRMPSSA